MFGFGKKNRIGASAIIPAAGSASRMEGLDKQRADLGGQPVLWHTLRAFERSPLIEEIILVCPGPAIAEYLFLTDEWRFKKLRSIVEGGQTRQQSVWNGIAACSPDAAYYCIHDGARPLVTEEVIAAAIEKAMEKGAATAAMPVKDTIKTAGPSGEILSTPDRATLYLTQTPQVFAAPLYREAMAAAKQAGRDYTDDCQLIEALGQTVWLAQGDYKNIKITTPEDLQIATALLYGEEMFL